MMKKKVWSDVVVSDLNFRQRIQGKVGEAWFVHELTGKAYRYTVRVSASKDQEGEISFTTFAGFIDLHNCRNVMWWDGDPESKVYKYLLAELYQSPVFEMTFYKDGDSEEPYKRAFYRAEPMDLGGTPAFKVHEASPENGYCQCREINI